MIEALRGGWAARLSPALEVVEPYSEGRREPSASRAV